MTIDTLHGALRSLASREISTVELIETMLRRLEATEPVLHNYVEIYAEEALAQARTADTLRASGASIPPLLGIPIGVKDIFDMTGKPTRCNSLLREDVASASADSDAVTSLTNDGAIMLGKTVTQEFAAGVVSAPARNPWDPARLPGGSSGGSAASVAAGTCLGALGSDTGGSIRIPASVNGVVGLKPTWGQISVAGVFPLSTSLDTVGPIAPSVIDAVMLYHSLRHRPESIAGTASDLERARSIEGQRIGVLASHFNEGLQPDVAAAFAGAVATLRELGAEIVECDWPQAKAARATALLISRIESAAVHADALRTAPDLMGEDLRSRLEVGSMLPGTVYIEALRVREAVKRSIAEVFRSNDLVAIAAPTSPATAPIVDAGVVAFPGGVTEAFGPALTRFTTPWNATGQPVISLPCGFDRESLPVGLSIVGRPHDEFGIAAIAHAYEQATEWHTRRPPIIQST
jgi:Asp-tRNA(Asn)/Glu-tRNA(Gln) amidotransferase A subunit family amidase